MGRKLTMRKCAEILRLRYEVGLGQQQIADSQAVSRGAVCRVLRRAKAAGVGWPLPEGMDDERLEALLFQNSGPNRDRPEPDWSQVHKELRSNKHVTLQLLWIEYRQAHGQDGYSYSRFCERYRAWHSSIDLVMRQEHKAGEKTFIDFAGDGIEIADPHTGEIKKAELFVAVLGASNYTFAWVCPDQKLSSWVDAHERMFEYFGGSTQILVPDNLKSGVTKADRYEPGINRTYEDLAQHYNAVVIPARAGKPKDKAKVENAVLVAERWIVAPLRKQTFFSIAEANDAVAEKREQLNSKPFQKLDGSRRSHYLEVDKPALQPLPEDRFEYREWKKVKLNVDYHVEIDGHYYSAPHKLANEKLWACISTRTVELLHKGRRVALHQRSLQKGKHTTVAQHMLEAHRQHAKWKPSRIISWAAKNGPATGELVKALIETKRHPQQGYRPSLGIIRLGDSYGKQRLEAACRRALSMGTVSYQSVKSILKTGQDTLPLHNRQLRVLTPSDHENIRGPDYYKGANDHVASADDRTTSRDENERIPDGSRGAGQSVQEPELRGEARHARRA